MVSIGMKALASCPSLKEVTFGDSLKRVGSYAFFGILFYDGSTKLDVAPDALAGHSFSGAAPRFYLVS